MPIITLPPALVPGVLFHEDVRLKINETITQSNLNVTNIATNGDRLTVLEDVQGGYSPVYLSTPAHFDRTFEAGVFYVVTAPIDLTGTGFSINVPAGGLTLYGHVNLSSITCSDPNYTLFTGSGPLDHEGITFSITGTNSKVYDLTANAVTDTVLGNRVFYIDCTSRGELNGYATALFATAQAFGGTPHLTLSGTWLSGYSEDNLNYGLLDPSMTGSLIREGTSLSLPTMIMVVGVDLSASVSFLDLQPSNFSSTSALKIDDSRFTRLGVTNPFDTNITPNISPDDVKSAFRDNRGIRNTIEQGVTEVTTEVANTFAGADDFNLVASTFTAGELVHFDAPSNGVLRHIGDTPVTYTVFLNVSASGSDGNLAKYELRRYNSATADETLLHTYEREILNLQGPNNIAQVNAVHITQLAHNDELRLYVADSVGSNITVRNGSTILIKV
jgi:hypothetical protein